MNTEAPPTVDGRRARRDQNRDRVVDALLEIYREGVLQPSVAEVARRSGVSHRSVFRYFENLDELCRVAVERQFQAVAEYLVLERTAGASSPELIDAIVEQRLALYDAAAPVARVGRMLAPTEPVLAEHLQRMAALAVEQVGSYFAPELDPMPAARRDAIVEAVAATLSIDSMDLLRAVRGLSRADTGHAMRLTLGALLETGER